MNKLNLMAFLLKYEAYPAAVFAALAVHALLLYFIISSGPLLNNQVSVEQPIYINASAIDVNPQRLRRLENLEQQRQEQARETERLERAERAEQARREQIRNDEIAAQNARDQQAAKDREIAETQRQERELEQRLAIEAEARAQAAEETRLENERVAQLARDQEAREEAARQAANQRQLEQAASDNQTVQSYMAIIRDDIMRNWFVPPSARNGMLVVLELRLVPTGEIIAYSVIANSGDAAFDRSALQAVARVDRFPELKDMPNRLFEQQFRIITLRFRPEDLLR